MVTKFSATHGVESLAKDLVAQLHDAARLAARARGRERPLPGEHDRRQAQVKDTDLKAFGRASRRRRADAEHPADGERLG